MAKFSRRKKFYRRCQQIVDDLHERVANGEYIDEESCKTIYGKADYNAFLHQLRKENADLNYKVMTPAMEWMYYSQHFKWLSREESRLSLNFWITFLSFFIALTSAILTGYNLK